MTTTPNFDQPEFLALYGVDLRVVHHGGMEYVDPRPLCDLGELNWPSIQVSLLCDEGLLLYGTKLLSSPNIPFDERPKGSDKPCPFIQLDRLHVLLMRIDTAKMRWRGHVVEAEQLLEDQILWAQTLHRAGSQ